MSAPVVPGTVPGAHVTTTDHAPADRLDTAAHAAFCNTCDWRGEWHHEDDPDDPDRAYLDASADAREHVVETGHAATP